MKYNKNIYWLASYPKSGNTWFRIFLSNYLSDSDKPVSINEINTGTIASSRVAFDDLSALPSSELKAEEIDVLRPEIYRRMSLEQEGVSFHKAHDAYLQTLNNEPLFPAEVSAGAIYFVRNPLDVAISFANHLSMSIDDTIDRMNDNDFGLSFSGKKISKQLRQKLLSWSNHYLSWTEQKSISVLVLKYEDMLEKTEESFKKAVKFLNLELDETKLKKAIKYSSFDFVKKQEEKEGFQEKPKKAKSFFNKGKSGNWQDVLTDEQINKIINSHYDVMKKLGYLP